MKSLLTTHNTQHKFKMTFTTLLTTYPTSKEATELLQKHGEIIGMQHLQLISLPSSLVKTLPMQVRIPAENVDNSIRSFLQTAIFTCTVKIIPDGDTFKEVPKEIFETACAITTWCMFEIDGISDDILETIVEGIKLVTPHITELKSILNNYVTLRPDELSLEEHVFEYALNNIYMSFSMYDGYIEENNNRKQK